MVKNKDERKDCKEKKLKDKKNKGGYKEIKDPLLGKGKRHTASAMKKDADVISDDVAISPAGNDKKGKEETVNPASADFEKETEDLEIIPDKDEESVILRYKDSVEENILEKVFAYEKKTGTTIPLDFDSDSESFILSIKKSETDKFRTFMKDFLEIPFSGEMEIEEVQSIRALAIDKKIKANSNTLDLLGEDGGEV